MSPITSPISSVPATIVTVEESRAIRSSWGWFLAMGIVMVILGTIAISYACVATITLAATWLFGWLMLAGGIAEIIHGFSVARWSGTLLHLMIGVLYVVVGFITVDQPGDTALILTRLIAIFLVVGGMFRIVAALAHRFNGWGSVLFNGVVSLVLGVMIYRQWPDSGLWFIGLYIGIEMILNGWAWIILALGLKRLPDTATA